LIHDHKFAGLSRKEKIRQVTKEMKELKADYHLITTLDDIAWLLNLRGSDISYCPFFISYCMVSASRTDLFINPDKNSDPIRKELSKDNILIHPYETISGFLEQLPDGSTIFFSPEKVNHALIQSIPYR